MDNIESQVRTKLKRNYDVIVAIISSKISQSDKEHAKTLAKRHQSEILICKHPTQCEENEREFIFGTAGYMRKETEYFEKFLKACVYEKGKVVQIMGVRL